MFLVGANNIEELKQSKLVISGKTKQWLEDRPIAKTMECKEDTSERLVCTGQILESKKNGRIYLKKGNKNFKFCHK